MVALKGFTPHKLVMPRRPLFNHTFSKVSFMSDIMAGSPRRIHTHWLVRIMISMRNQNQQPVAFSLTFKNTDYLGN